MTGGHSGRRRGAPRGVNEEPAKGARAVHLGDRWGLPGRGGSELGSGDPIVKVGGPWDTAVTPQIQASLHLVKPGGTEGCLYQTLI